MVTSKGSGTVSHNGKKFFPRGSDIVCGTGHRVVLHSTRQNIAYHATMQLKLIAPVAAWSGMARGFDLIWARAILDVGVPLLCAIPFKGQEARWLYSQRKEYDDILALASEVYYLFGDEYLGPWQYLERNKHMVNYSNKLVEWFDGRETGGTRHCHDYAVKKGLQIINLKDKVDAKET